MKKSTSWLAALLILAGSPPALRAAAPPLFAPEPPEPAAGALVEAYLPLLVAGQYEQALTLVDLRGLRRVQQDHVDGFLVPDGDGVRALVQHPNSQRPANRNVDLAAGRPL